MGDEPIRPMTAEFENVPCASRRNRAKGRNPLRNKGIRDEQAFDPAWPGERDLWAERHTCRNSAATWLGVQSSVPPRKKKIPCDRAWRHGFLGVFGEEVLEAVEGEGRHHQPAQGPKCGVQEIPGAPEPRRPARARDVRREGMPFHHGEP